MTVSPGVTISCLARLAGRIELSPSKSTPPSESEESMLSRRENGRPAGAGARIVIAMVRWIIRFGFCW